MTTRRQAGRTEEAALALGLGGTMAANARINLATRRLRDEIEQLESPEAASRQERVLRLEHALGSLEVLRLEKQLRIVEAGLAGGLREDRAREVIAELMKELPTQHLARDVAVEQSSRPTERETVSFGMKGDL